MSALRRRVPRQDRSKEKVERILAAARALLEQEGPTRFNTNRVAKDAGVGIGTLYEYFPNKSAIIRALIEALAESESSAVLSRFATLAEASPPELLRGLVETTYLLYLENQALYAALWALADEPREIGNRASERAIIDLVAEWIRANALPVEDADVAAFTAFHLVESLSSRLVAHKREAWSTAQAVDEICRVVGRYLRIEGCP